MKPPRLPSSEELTQSYTYLIRRPMNQHLQNPLPTISNNLLESKSQNLHFTASIEDKSNLHSFRLQFVRGIVDNDLSTPSQLLKLLDNMIKKE